jgi:hypothetical protein
MNITVDSGENGPKWSYIFEVDDLMIRCVFTDVVPNIRVVTRANLVEMVRLASYFKMYAIGGDSVRTIMTNKYRRYIIAERETPHLERILSMITDLPWSTPYDVRVEAEDPRSHTIAINVRDRSLH